MHACWILLCMSLNLVSYVCLLIKEGISKSTKSKGGLEGSMTHHVDGWGCYRSNFDCEFEKLRRNGIVESMQDIEHQRPVVSGSKDHDRPLQIQE
jgi:hypothetical protein